ncbi:hypothetical protein ACWT_3018 [Actinoplanes sp. SE50]|uniref:CHAT domain-containing protein n=1 Tax=unclassified Actinoplanes TaxID=2626549 RepID=UPI00023EBF05|nr:MULTISPECIES: CHAT domain-containing protein [unclassified Actinoplanes]AEV84040.1 hypothetical protein ACPL_3145 [Actinoplanes sp. SE50/110]ATO82433.1 hypothetical protein ACWT_3018 [Actinoplanes sp. SE50]SLL99840.1 hypothetical protein ACSP50_3072 [Actinoplanes sp. SE50/110]
MTADDLGMRRSVQNRLGGSDPFPGQRTPEPARLPLHRTIYLRLDADPDGSCRMTLMGDGLGDDGGGPLGGRLASTEKDLLAMADRLRKVWTDGFVLFLADDDVADDRCRFAADFDLSAHRDTPEWDAALRRLARTGYDVFRAVFLTGDAGLRRAGERLRDMLRAGPQVISFHSDVIFLPWQMLYVPPDGQDLLDDDCAWEFDGFLGFRHHVEHVFSDRPDSFRHRLDATGGIRAGLNYDAALDRMTPPVLRPLREMLESLPAERIERRWRETFPALDRALRADDYNDQIMYFNCHGWVTAAGPEEAYIALTDGRPIYKTHFREWLTGRPLVHSPVVLINACEGAQLSSMFLDSFGLALLAAEANCLIGPQIEIPASFAARYAVEFFRELLRGVSVGAVVRGLARGFAERHANPLGLAISSYRGMDTYFDVSNSADPAPATQRILLVSDDPVERRRTPA